MPSTNKFIARVNSIFETEEKIGVFYQNEDGLLETDFIGTEEERFNEEFSATLPDGKNMSRCTNCAHFVVNTLGEGNVYGFLTEDNPVKSDAINWCFGHDFAVIRKRYIVDIWLSLYGGHEKQTIFDLQNPHDKEKIAHYYGNPELWSMIDPKSECFMSQSSLPEQYKISPRIPAQEPNNSLAMS